LPIGALIFIDEIQDVYPNDKSFKAGDYDYRSEGFFDAHLSTDFVELYHREQRKIKNNIDVDDYLDDLGNSLFDGKDYLRYPRTLRECFMRHRHYNWDILIATPDIKEVSGFVRSVCEIAYCHSSKDAIPIPYYKRRPRILEHMPKTNGLKADKNDIVTFKKIPLDVFKLYKSTATGKSTKSGAGQSPFTFQLVAGFALILLYIFYMVFFFFDDDSDKVLDSSGKAKIAQIQPSKESFKGSQRVSEKSSKNGSKGAVSIDDVSFRDASVSSIIASNNFVGLPYDASKIYVNGITTTTFGRTAVFRDYVFTLYVGGEAFSTNSEVLKSMGYKIFYKSDCMVELRSDVSSNYVYCEPERVESQVEEGNSSPVSVSML
jgi:zona occludens toxin